MDWLLVATAVRLVTAVGSVDDEKSTHLCVYSILFVCNAKLTNCYRPACCHFTGSGHTTFDVECMYCHLVVSVRQSTWNYILLLTSIDHYWT